VRYIPKAESYDRRGTRRKLYCIIAGSSVSSNDVFSIVSKPEKPRKSKVRDW
jgi:hypothetical protein